MARLPAVRQDQRVDFEEGDIGLAGGGDAEMVFIDGESTRETGESMGDNIIYIVVYTIMADIICI